NYADIPRRTNPGPPRRATTRSMPECLSPSGSPRSREFSRSSAQRRFSERRLTSPCRNSPSNPSSQPMRPLLLSCVVFLTPITSRQNKIRNDNLARLSPGLRIFRSIKIMILDLLENGSPSHIAVAVSGDGPVVTYDQLRRQVDALVSQLHNLGLGRGDRIAM